MRRVSFDYGNTCPKIDKLIAQADSVISNHLSELLEEACPMLPREKHSQEVDARSRRLYQDLEDIFEGVRSTNEDMRREAERQIADLQDRIADLEHDLESQS